MSNKSSLIPVLLKLALAAALIVAVIVGFNAYSRPTAKVEAVISGEANDAKSGSVNVQAKYSMQIKTQVPGRVLEKDFKLDAGNHVKKDDVLAYLDATDIELRIEQAQNEFDSAKRRIEVGSNLKFQLEDAQSAFANVEHSFKQGLVSDSEYQSARRKVEGLKQQLLVENVINEENLKTDETTLKTLQHEKEKMTIRSPLDGEVSAVFAHPGDLVDPGAAIVTLIMTDRVVEAKISEEDFANIKVGQIVSATFLPYGAWIYNGTVKKILPTADPVTQRHLVDLDITDIDPAKLVPGITGEVTIVVGARHANAIIPRRAIVNENVYVVTDGVVHLRPIKKGYVWLTGAEVLEGLAPGEQVIVEDIESFHDGDRVRIQELPSDAGSAKK